MRSSDWFRFAGFAFSTAVVMFVTAIWTGSDKIGGTGGVVLGVAAVLVLGGFIRYFEEDDEKQEAERRERQRGYRW